MSIVQKNVFGDNIIYQVSPNYTRNLNKELETEIISILRALGVSSIIIRIENGAETKQFAQTVAKFLIKNGFNNVKIIPVMMSEITRGEFSIQKHPSDPDFAIIKIGPLI